MSLWEKIKRLFSGKSKEDAFDRESKILQERNLNNGALDCQLISFSDANYTCSMAAKICIGKDVDSDYSKRLEHIARVVGRGHESTIAQSNIVMLLSFNQSYERSFFDLTGATKFLNVVTRHNPDIDITYALIGGSIRAYKYFIRETDDLTNPISKAIRDNLYISCEKEFFLDMIEDDIMYADKFTFLPTGESKIEEEKYFNDNKELETGHVQTTTESHQEITMGNVVDIVYSDDPYAVLDSVKGFGFTLRDVLKCTSCTIRFHDISRSVSQQITRHFAGISQESQRYVNYSEANFICPCRFNKEQYPNGNDTKITINDKEYTAQSFGEEISKYYEQLLNQNFLKQDARGYLPFNVTTKILMTFTFSDLIHFLNMRLDKASQPEVQAISKELLENLKKHEESSFLFTSNKIENLITLIESPKYKFYIKAITTNDNVDEVISEEIMEEPIK